MKKISIKATDNRRRNGVTYRNADGEIMVDVKVQPGGVEVLHDAYGWMSDDYLTMDEVERARSESGIAASWPAKR